MWTAHSFFLLGLKFLTLAAPSGPRAGTPAPPIGRRALLSEGQAQEEMSGGGTGLGNEFSSEIATVNGIKLHYVRGGKGPAVILIHGFPEDWFEYRAIMPRLAK